MLCRPGEWAWEIYPKGEPRMQVDQPWMLEFLGKWAWETSPRAKGDEGRASARSNGSRCDFLWLQLWRSRRLAIAWSICRSRASPTRGWSRAMTWFAQATRRSSFHCAQGQVFQRCPQILLLSSVSHGEIGEGGVKDQNCALQRQLDLKSVVVEQPMPGGVRTPYSYIPCRAQRVSEIVAPLPPLFPCCLEHFLSRNILRAIRISGTVG